MNPMTRAANRFTIEDYRRLPEGYPAQLIDGALIKEPSPTLWHQAIVLELCLVFRRQVGRGRVLASPVDFPLDRDNVFQPDVVVLPRPFVAGPEDREIETPLLVVEVLSPSTAHRDREIKTRRYLDKGVREVWLVDPVSRRIEIRTRDGSRELGPGETLRSGALPDLAVPADRIFVS